MALLCRASQLRRLVRLRASSGRLPTKYTINRAGYNRRRTSRVSVTSTTRSTSSGGNVLVDAPTDTRSGSQPSGETPSAPSCATAGSSRRTITRPGTSTACRRPDQLKARPLGRGAASSTDLRSSYHRRRRTTLAVADTHCGPAVHRLWTLGRSSLMLSQPRRYIDPTSHRLD